jgi:toxin ParE1/3/4
VNFVANAQLLPTHRSAWGARNELRGGFRSSPYKSYVIFFRYVGDALEIVNVIEGHRDIAALFAEEE